MKKELFIVLFSILLGFSQFNCTTQSTASKSEVKEEVEEEVEEEIVEDLPTRIEKYLYNVNWLMDKEKTFQNDTSTFGIDIYLTFDRPSSKTATEIGDNFSIFDFKIENDIIISYDNGVEISRAIIEYLRKESLIVTSTITATGETKKYFFDSVDSR